MKLSITFRTVKIDHDDGYCTDNELEAEYGTRTVLYEIPQRFKELETHLMNFHNITDETIEGDCFEILDKKSKLPFVSIPAYLLDALVEHFTFSKPTISDMGSGYCNPHKLSSEETEYEYHAITYEPLNIFVYGPNTFQ